MGLSLLLPSILFLLFLFLMSAFFSCSESALTAASHARMHVMEKNGDWRARAVNRVLANKDLLIGTLLLGNNTVNVMAASIMTGILIKLFGDVGVLYATAAMSVLLLVFSEVLPKTYAIYNADAVARMVAPIIQWFVFFTAPITRSVTWFIERALAVCGVQIDRSKRIADLEELRGVIDLHEGMDKDTQERRNMLRAILSLSELTVEDVMIHRKNVNGVNFGQPVAQAVHEILNYNRTRIPIWSAMPENIIGVVHLKQLLFTLNDVKGDASQIDLLRMMNKPWFVPNTTRLLDQLRAFRERREHFAVVIDEYGTFMGIVTLEDILEEIVGDIQDEEDLPMPGLRKMPDGAYLANGNLTIRELNRQLAFGLPEDAGYTTLAGLVIYESRSLPETGQMFSFYDHQFEIVKRVRNQINVIRISR